MSEPHSNSTQCLSVDHIRAWIVDALFIDDTHAECSFEYELVHCKESTKISDAPKCSNRHEKEGESE